MSSSVEPGVLDGVVQQRGHQRRGVHAQLGEDRGHRQRVRDVRVAALAQLAAVAFLGQVVAALQQPRVDLRVGAAVDGEQRLEDRLDRRLARRGDQPAGQPIAHPAAVGAGLDRVSAEAGRLGSAAGSDCYCRRRGAAGTAGGIGAVATSASVPVPAPRGGGGVRRQARLPVCRWCHGQVYGPFGTARSDAQQRVQRGDIGQLSAAAEEAEFEQHAESR